MRSDCDALAGELGGWSHSMVEIWRMLEEITNDRGGISYLQALRDFVK